MHDTANVHALFHSLQLLCTCNSRKVCHFFTSVWFTFGKAFVLEVGWLNHFRATSPQWSEVLCRRHPAPAHCSVPMQYSQAHPSGLQVFPSSRTPSHTQTLMCMCAHAHAHHTHTHTHHMPHTPHTHTTHTHTHHVHMHARSQQLYCRLTGRYINKLPDHVERHRKGKRFTSALERCESHMSMHTHTLTPVQKRMLCVCTFTSAHLSISDIICREMHVFANICSNGRSCSSCDKCYEGIQADTSQCNML